MEEGISKEVGAMISIEKALENLDEAARRRVLLWASGKFEVENKSNLNSEQINIRGDGQQLLNCDRSDLSVAEYFDAANPQTDMDKALVVSAWHQEVKKVENVDSQMVNTDLKQLGYGIGNITRAYENLKKTRPAQVIQIQKSGNSKQARKKYKVTKVGLEKVWELMNGSK